MRENNSFPNRNKSCQIDEIGIGEKRQEVRYKTVRECASTICMSNVQLMR